MREWKTGVLCALAALGVSAGEPLTLVRDGAAVSVVYCAPDATPSERYAAEELQRYVEAATGARLPIRAAFPDDGRAVLVGWSAPAAERCPDVDPASWRPDEILVRRAGDALVLAGERPRGAIYAVYEFLETELGVRFWSHDATEIPRRADVSVGDLDVRYHPPFAIREAFSRETNQIPELAVRLRNNGHWNLNISERMGGHHVYCPNFAHTFETFLPYDRYKETHPEYFTLLGDQRYRAQLCFSNPAMRKEFIANVLAFLAERPDCRLLELSQIDGVLERHSCTCDGCKALREKLGGSTDVLIHFLNEVAEAVTARHPAVRIETLSYNYTRAAPKTVKPHPALLIRLCLATRNLSLSHPENAELKRDYEDWRALGVPIGLWLYKVNHAATLLPFPNLRGYGGELRFFAENPKLFSVFLQGSQQGASEFDELRAYLGSRLMWNPRRDADGEIAAFVNGFYGPAAPAVAAYIRLMADEVEDREIPVTGPHAEEAFPFDLLVRAHALMKEATAAAPEDSVWRARVRRAAVPVELALASREELSWRNRTAEGRALRARYDAPRWLAEIGREAETLGIRQFAEHVPLGPVLAERIADAAFPAPTEPLPDLSVVPADEGVLELGATRLLARFGAALRDAPAAVGGKAVGMALDKHSWAVTASLPVLRDPVPWQVWVTARCVASKAPDDGQAFGAGLRDVKGEKYLTPGVEKIFTVGETRGDSFKAFKVGECVLDRDVTLFLTPRPAGGVKDIEFERVLLVQPR